MKRKLLSLSLCFCLSLLTSMTSIAATTSNSTTLDLTENVALSNTAISIKETGENLVAPQNLVSSPSALDDDDIVITAATVQNEAIQLVGTANGEAFDISGDFCSISENGNVLVFDATDSTGNFRVVYCAVEKDLDKAALYFDEFAKSNSEYDVVTKLYLAPNSGAEGEYIMTELYGNEFPAISAESIAALPENHELNLFWYAKEFKPVSTDEEMIETRAGNPSHTMLESYTYQNLGLTYKHYLRYEEQCDIRDVTCNQSSTASATLKVTQKWIDADLENDCSSTSSTLSLRNISVGYLTMPNTAVTSMISQGQVTRSGSIKVNYSLKLGVGLKGLSLPTSASVSWTPESKNYDAGTKINLYTNTAGQYYRDAVSIVDSSNSLDAIGNNISVKWDYSSYSSTPSSGSANLVFTFGVNNLLDYTQYKPVEHFRSINVNVTN